MDFGSALKALRDGEKVTRAGWNGADQYVYLIPAASYPAQTDVAKAAFPSGMVPYREYLAIKTTAGDVATWAPSCSDALADDWRMVERGTQSESLFGGERESGAFKTENETDTSGSA